MHQKNIVILRPGALGDALVCRHLLHSLKKESPAPRITFIAPGERAKLFAHFALADKALDWENAAFSWLFSEENTFPPMILRTLFTPETTIFAYLDLDEERKALFKKKIEQISQNTDIHFSPSRPQNTLIGKWLVEEAGGIYDPLGGCFETSTPRDEKLLIIHPGSGSPKKNWNLKNFAELSRRLLNDQHVERIKILSGEADCTLGEELKKMLPIAELLAPTDLITLAKTLAEAGIYLGNDSGVTHLAAAVGMPKIAAVFGESDPAVWAEPGALVLNAGQGMNSLPPEQAYSAIKQSFFP